MKDRNKCGARSTCMPALLYFLVTSTFNRRTMHLHEWMPIFSLGYDLGRLVLQLWTILLSWLFHVRGVEAAGGPPGSGSPESRDLEPGYGLYDPRSSVCRFPNTFRNSWISATLQAALHLKAVQREFGRRHWRLLAEVSSMTTLPQVFHSALENPGRTFTEKEMFELSQELIILWKNDPLDLVRPLLSWFEHCGLQTAISVNEVRTCERCNETTFRNSDLGNVLVLPRRATGVSVSSLARQAGVFEQECAACTHVTETKRSWKFPDILTLHLPRGDSAARAIASEEMEVRLEDHEKLTYTLSSVVAHGGRGTYTGHMWSYLLLPHVTVQVDDCQVSLVEGRPQKLHSSGVLFFYERRGDHIAAPAM